MPKVIVEIQWDWPDEKDWLCPDNIALALRHVCRGTRFAVKPVEPRTRYIFYLGPTGTSLDQQGPFRRRKVLKTEADYESALTYVQTLMDAAPDSPEEEALEVFELLISAYEQAHYAIDPPSPFESFGAEMERCIEHSKRVLDRFWRWLAWQLPHRVAMWAAIRVAAHATTGEYGDTEVPKLTAMDALLRWDIKVARGGAGVE